MELNIRDAAANLSTSSTTPFYLLDLAGIEESTKRTIHAWRCQFPKVEVAYSFKSNSLRAITQLMREQGLSAEVTSGAELEFALEDGFSPKNIIFNGPVKLRSELLRALEFPTRVQVDSIQEIEDLLGLIREGEKRPRIGLRLATMYRGKHVSRLGFNDEEYEEAVRRLSKKNIEVEGLHMHVGSNLPSPSLYEDEIVRHWEKIASLLEKRGEESWIDIGGGFPANSIGHDKDAEGPELFANRVSNTFETRGVKTATVNLIIEPGRSLVEDHGFLITRVVTKKKRSYGNIVVVDAGIHLTRSISGWHHPVEFVQKGAENEYIIYGYNCFESDKFSGSVLGPENIKIGDAVIVGEVGGYDIPSANVWTRPAPAIFGLAKDGNIALLRKPEEWSEIRNNDVDNFDEKKSENS